LLSGYFTVWYALSRPKVDASEECGNQPYWKASRDQLAALVAGKTITVT
jgi:hypothetical protein